MKRKLKYTYSGIIIILVILLLFNSCTSEKTIETVNSVIDESSNSSTTKEKQVLNVKNIEDTKEIDYQDNVSILEDAATKAISQVTSNKVTVDKDISKEIKEKQILVIPPNKNIENGIACKVDNVIVDNKSTIIEYTKPELNEVVDSIKMEETTLSPDYEEIQTLLPGVSINATTPTNDMNSILNLEKMAYSNSIKDINIGFNNVDFGGLQVSGSFIIKELSLDISDVNIDVASGKIKHFGVLAKYNGKQSISVATDNMKFIETKPVYLLIVPFTIGLINISLYLRAKFDVSGHITFSLEETVRSGIEINNNKVTPINELSVKPDFYLEAEANLHVGPDIILSSLNLSVIDVWAYSGAAANARSYPPPLTCIDINLFIPAAIEWGTEKTWANKIGIKGVVTFWNEETSRWKKNFHIAGHACPHNGNQNENSSSQQPNANESEWQRAYKSLVKENIKNYSMDGQSTSLWLMNMDEDNIPEMYLYLPNQTPGAVKLYTFKGGEVKELSSAARTDYYYKGKTVVSHYYHMGAEVVNEFNLSNGNLEFNEIFSKLPGAETKCFYRGKEISETDFDMLRDSYLAKYKKCEIFNTSLNSIDTIDWNKYTIK